MTTLPGDQVELYTGPFCNLARSLRFSNNRGYHQVLKYSKLAMDVSNVTMLATPTSSFTGRGVASALHV